MKALAKMLILLLMVPASHLFAQQHSATGKHDSTSHVMLNPDAFKWMSAPEGLPKGAKVAVLSGDPSQPGPFTLRVTFPPNYQIKPHWHPSAENLTVLDGEIFMGTSQMFDPAKGTPIGKGGFVSMPAKSVHFLYTKAAATIQVNAIGPFAITYVNKNDDPRLQAQ